MRIAYLVHFRGGAETGIFRKVATHADEWTRRGHEVGLFVATDPAAEADWRALPQAVAVSAASTGARAMLVGRERLAGRLLRWRPDVVYARHTLAYPGLIRVVRRFPTVFEINSDDLAEFRLVSPRRHRFASLTRGVLLSRAAGLVFVTRELARSAAFARYRRPSVVVANGVRLADYPEFAAPVNEHPRLIFLGHPRTPWHGLASLEAMAGEFPAWQFDVVGPGPAEFTSQRPSNVVLHGELAAERYRPLMARSDVAVGTLGLYLKHMEEASPLKTREYLACGLPAIVGYDDTDFPDGASFLLQIPNRADGVATSIAAIRTFVTNWQYRRVQRDAVAILDVAAKEARRLEFLERVGAPRRRPNRQRSMTLPVSVVLVTWNSASVLTAAMQALMASDPPPAELIVVDNASTDDSAEIVSTIAASHPDIDLTIRREPGNTGFAAAANRGIEAAGQPFVFLHNPDLRLLPQTLARLVASIEEGPPSVAAVGPKLLRAAGSDLTPTDIIDTTGIVMTRDGRHLDRGAGETDDGQFDTDEDVFGLSGAAVLYRRDALERSTVDRQIFDEDFFAFREDADLAWRLRGYGFGARYVAGAVAYHRRSVTPERRRSLSAAVNMHSVKNCFLLRIHHADRGWLVHFGARSLIRDLVVVVACLTVERSSWPAIPWVLRNLARHRHRRREILRRRTVASAELRSWFR